MAFDDQLTIMYVRSAQESTRRKESMTKTHKLHREQYVGRPLPEVFQFFERPENLALLTPPSLGFRMLTPSPILMRKGTVIDYSIRVMGVRMKWQTLISAYAPLSAFSDEQVRGPYAFWHHTHAFVESDGGTLLTDEVQYALPFGVLGRIGQSLIVQRQLEQIFSYRAQAIERIFSSEE
jgi:ligand-binding SRPBCC domain-containing protein